FLLSPLVLVHGLSGAHNDALVAGLVVAAFALAVGSTPAWTPRALAVGVLLGLAVAVKATPAVAVPFAVLLVAADRRWRSIHRARPRGAGHRCGAARLGGARPGGVPVVRADRGGRARLRRGRGPLAVPDGAARRAGGFPDPAQRQRPRRAVQGDGIPDRRGAG